MLFQNEPDEPDSPTLFGDEPGETDRFLFQDEPPEPDGSLRRSNRSQSVSLNLLREEPDECSCGPQVDQFLFGDEPDEDDSESVSGDSAYDADGEVEPDKQALVQLNFSVLNNFLSKNLFKSDASTTAEPVKKKRRYNNLNRSAAAAAKRSLKGTEKRRTARNDPDTWMVCLHSV